MEYPLISPLEYQYFQHDLKVQVNVFSESQGKLLNEK